MPATTQPLKIDWTRHWQLDAHVTFLNHGSFGACPTRILGYQSELRARMESEPVRFFVRELPGLLETARAELAEFIGADAQRLAFVSNTTTGVNTVLRSLTLAPGDELLTTDHAYGACKNALDFIAERTGAQVVVAQVPFPIDSADTIVEAILERVSPRTRLALLDHVTSKTALIFPIERLVAELDARGVDTLVDAAHAPGMVPLDVESIGAAYYTANCHKWLCAPKGSAFLHVRADRIAHLRPLAISHGATFVDPGRTRFQLEFDWTGTQDPTAFLCVPEAIRFMRSLVPGGWPALMQHNHTLASQARTLICQRLGITLPCPDAMLGAMAAIPIADGRDETPRSPLYLDPLQDELFLEHGIDVPIVPFPAPPRRLLRVSAQLYNSLAQYDLLADALANSPMTS
ncbi:MAG: aminotransferase class V-fold PLP-dependent enzyme [Bradymonadaceae bacterium]|nr:aminotransferase class V-fold PLP-dependent enzyme [Lujinxingiaceae bacterium]